MSNLPYDLTDDAIFDRLVDGELSASERQQLLAALDTTDDGWRRCALAFLEAQTWGQQIKHLVTSPRSNPNCSLLLRRLLAKQFQRAGSLSRQV